MEHQRTWRNKCIHVVYPGFARGKIRVQGDWVAPIGKTDIPGSSRASNPFAGSRSVMVEVLMMVHRVRHQIAVTSALNSLTTLPERNGLLCQ
jgi:hypothetical protein